MIDPGIAAEFLAQRRLALVGASDDPKRFARAVAEALRAHGVDVVPVNPAHDTVDGGPCYPDVAAIPRPVDGAIVMVKADRAADVVRSCIEAGVRRIWLFQGIGGTSVSDEAVALCRDHGVTVVDGACPLMFLEPVAWFHRAHRAVRRARGALAAA